MVIGVKEVMKFALWKTWIITYKYVWQKFVVSFFVYKMTNASSLKEIFCVLNE